MEQLFFFFCFRHHLHQSSSQDVVNVALNAAPLILASHAGMKPFKCNVCAASFTTNGSLNRHMIIHAKSFKCSVCDESFRSSLLCKKHMKKEHSMDDQSRNMNKERKMLEYVVIMQKKLMFPSLYSGINLIFCAAG